MFHIRAAISIKQLFGCEKLLLFLPGRASRHRRRAALDWRPLSRDGAALRTTGNDAMVLSSSVSPVDYLKEQKQEVSIYCVIKYHRTLHDTKWHNYNVYTMYCTILVGVLSLLSLGSGYWWLLYVFFSGTS